MKKLSIYKEFILINAIEMFTARGFEDTKMHDVAEASSSPLYILLELFEDKQTMFNQCKQYAEGLISNKEAAEDMKLSETIDMMKDFCKSSGAAPREYNHTAINPLIPIWII